MKLGERVCLVLARRFLEEVYDGEVCCPAACSTLGHALSPTLGSLLTWGFSEPPVGMEMVHLEEKPLLDPECSAKCSETSR